MANLFLHEAVPRMMLNLITVGITMKLKVLLIVMEAPVSTKVHKLFMHFFMHFIFKQGCLKNYSELIIDGSPNMVTFIPQEQAVV